jgi:hypothetical protein
LGSRTLEASRRVLNLGNGQDLDDGGDRARHLTGPMTMCWMGQMILIIGTITSSTSFFGDRRGQGPDLLGVCEVE